MKGLDLRQFKKIASNDKTTTLSHKDGHKITIAHKALSKGHRKALESLPMANGGEVDPDTLGPNFMNQEEQDKAMKEDQPLSSLYNPKRSPSSDDDEEPQQKAKGGEVKRYAKGTDDVPEPDPKKAAAMQRGVDPKAKGSEPSTKKEGDGWSSTAITRPSAPNKADQEYKSEVDKFNAQMGVQAKAKGGQVKKYADGTPDEPVSSSAQDSPEQIASDAKSQPTININVGGQPAQQQQPQPASVPVTVPPPASSGSELPPGIANGQELVNYIQSAGGSNRNAGNPVVMPPEIKQPDNLQGMLNQNAQPPAPSVPDYMREGVQSQMAGMQKKYDAEAMAAQGREKAQQQYIKDIQEQQQDFDTKMAGYQSERTAAFQDLKDQHIDPDHFWNSKSTLGKISTIIGLIAGGLGGNSTTKWLDDQVDRDISAQKANIDNKRGVLSALRDQFQDTNTAAQFHRVMMNDQVSHQIDLAMARAATPMAKAALLSEQGKLQMDSGIRLNEIYAKQTLNDPRTSPSLKQAAINKLQATNPKLAEEYQGRIVPGIGFANTQKDAEQAKEVMSRKAEMLNNIDKLDKMIEDKGTFEMFGEHSATMERLLDNLATDQAKLTDPSSTARESEVNLARKSLPSANSLFQRNETARALLSKFREETEHRANTRLGLYGLKLSPAQQGKAKFTEGK